MERTIIIILVMVSSFNLMLAQDNDEELEAYGFIEIKTDSMNVPFFIDGYYVGNHPLKDPIPVLPGFHEVSYIPPDIQDEKVKDTLTEGIKRVYVAENDTLKVFLFYDHYLSQVETLHEEIKIQNYVGLSLFGVLVYLLLSIL
jgi:hypothetical protein|tara:strand:+ start:1479 stop:1907 length:429 start_codon:yes stop_codon:yes gene_type:complete